MTTNESQKHKYFEQTRCDSCNGTGRYRIESKRFALLVIVLLLILSYSLLLSYCLGDITGHVRRMLELVDVLCILALLYSIFRASFPSTCGACKGSGRMTITPRRATPYPWPADRARLGTCRCPQCGYDVSECSGDVCPECNWEIPDDIRRFGPRIEDD